MDPRTIARAVAVGRLGFGAGLVAFPGFFASRWVGSDGDSAGARTLAMGLGARDLALGGGALAALANGGARPWIIGSTAGDIGDLVATLRHRRDLPSASVAMIAVLAGGAAATGAWLSAQDDW
jgi:hypothetical protein